MHDVPQSLRETPDRLSDSCPVQSPRLCRLLDAPQPRTGWAKNDLVDRNRAVGNADGPTIAGDDKRIAVCRRVTAISLQREVLFASARISAQANCLCPGCRNKKAGCSMASARISPPTWRGKSNHEPRVRIIPPSTPNNVRAADAPRQTRNSGLARWICRLMKGRHVCVSWGVGVRLPGGRQGTTLAM